MTEEPRTGGWWARVFGGSSPQLTPEEHGQLLANEIDRLHGDVEAKAARIANLESEVRVADRLRADHAQLVLVRDRESKQAEDRVRTLQLDLAAKQAELESRGRAHGSLVEQLEALRATEERRRREKSESAKRFQKLLDTQRHTREELIAHKQSATKDVSRIAEIEAHVERLQAARGADAQARETEARKAAAGLVSLRQELEATKSAAGEASKARRTSRKRVEAAEEVTVKAQHDLDALRAQASALGGLFDTVVRANTEFGEHWFGAAHRMAASAEAFDVTVEFANTSAAMIPIALATFTSFTAQHDRVSGVLKLDDRFATRNVLLARVLDAMSVRGAESTKLPSSEQSVSTTPTEKKPT